MHTFMHVRMDVCVCVDAYEQVYSTCRVCVRVKVIHGRMHDEGTRER